MYQRLSSDKVNFGDWSSGKIVLYPFFRYVKFRTGKVTYKIDIIDIWRWLEWLLFALSRERFCGGQLFLYSGDRSWWIFEAKMQCHLGLTFRAINIFWSIAIAALSQSTEDDFSDVVGLCICSRQLLKKFFCWVFLAFPPLGWIAEVVNCTTKEICMTNNVWVVQKPIKDARELPRY